MKNKLALVYFFILLSNDSIAQLIGLERRDKSENWLYIFVGLVIIIAIGYFVWQKMKKNKV